MLLRTEGVNCASLTGHADGEPPDCRAIYKAFVRGRDHYDTVDPRARDVQMVHFTFFRPAGVAVRAGAPRIPFGPTQFVQGYFSPPTFIAYAQEAGVYCEALHGIALALGDPGWRETGHGGPNDKLDFECWRVVQDEWQRQQPLE